MQWVPLLSSGSGSDEPAIIPEPEFHVQLIPDPLEAAAGLETAGGASSYGGASSSSATYVGAPSKSAAKRPVDAQGPRISFDVSVTCIILAGLSDFVAACHVVSCHAIMSILGECRTF
jgi:hypothetical protein